MIEDGLSGGRVTTSTEWPMYFIEKLDPWSPRAAIDGYITTDRQGDTHYSIKTKWVKTGSVGLVKGPGNRMSNLYACSLWKLLDPSNNGAIGLGDYNFYLRISTYPDSGSAQSNQLFRKYNAVKDNNYPVISLTRYRELKTRRDASLQQSGTNSTVSGPTNGRNFNADTLARDVSSNYVNPGDAYYASINNQTGTGNGGGGGGGGTGNGTNDTDTSTAYEMDSAVRLVVRMPIGYAGVATSQSTKPGFVQTWLNPNGHTYTDEFLFRYIPQNIKYDGLASEWVEIPRAENLPFIDWARWPLMKVSMSFIIASDRVETGGAIVPDGMSIAVEPQIQKLRQMAQRKVPITFINMDELLTIQLRRGKDLGRGLEFVINDMSVTATRRATDFTTGTASTPSGISVAQIEMTFTEVPVERVSVVYLAPIGAPPLPVPKTTTAGGGPVEYARLSLVATGGPNRTTTVYTDDSAK
jgi:hypothetical protein